MEARVPFSAQHVYLETFYCTTEIYIRTKLQCFTMDCLPIWQNWIHCKLVLNCDSVFVGFDSYACKRKWVWLQFFCTILVLLRAPPVQYYSSFTWILFINIDSSCSWILVIIFYKTIMLSIICFILIVNFFPRELNSNSISFLSERVFVQQRNLHFL